MLELREIGVAYGVATALRGVSLRIGAGELVCVVGPNGAGKTTLVNAIGGLIRIVAGGIELDGADIGALPAHEICARGIAMVPEGRRLWTNMTVRENLELGGYRSGARAARKEWMERVVAMFPLLGARLDAPAGTLSGGQQQMVAIGRALMAQPRLLLLDEPSLGLAPAIVLDMFNVIRDIHASGVAVLLVEQNVARALEIASRAYILDEGQIVAEGTPAELRNESHIARAYLGL